MLLTAQRPISDTYPVEASGWDSDQSFFVENAELEWNELTGKHVTLSRSLSPGSMIFLRLLQPMSADRALPRCVPCAGHEITGGVVSQK